MEHGTSNIRVVMNCPINFMPFAPAVQNARAHKGVMSHHHSLTVANFRDGDLVDDAPVEPVGGRRVALHRRVQPLAGREQRRVVSVRRDGLVGKGRQANSVR